MQTRNRSQSSAGMPHPSSDSDTYWIPPSRGGTVCVPKKESRKETGQAKCLLCRCPYNRPMNLNCYHTFCVHCLRRLVDIWSQFLGGSSDQQETFPCPECRQFVVVPSGGVDNLHENDYVRGISDAEFRKQYRTEQERQIYCLICDNTNPVASACAECKLLMCDHCGYFHDQFFPHNEHSRKDIHVCSGGSAKSSESLGFEIIPPLILNPSIQSTIDSRVSYDDVYEDEPFGLRGPLHIGKLTLNPATPKTHSEPVRRYPPPLPPRQIKRSQSISTSRFDANVRVYTTQQYPVFDGDSEDPYNAIQDEASSGESACAFTPGPLQRSLQPNERKQGRPLSIHPAELPLSSSRILPEPKMWTVKWPNATVAVISVSADKVFLLGTGPQKIPKLGVFSNDGTKISKTVMDCKTMALLDDFQETRLVLGGDSPPLKWSPADRPLELTTIRQLYLAKMVLSKSVPGGPLYVIGTNEGFHQIQRVRLDRSTPPHRLEHKGKILAFDVSSAETHFAVLSRSSELTVDVYQKHEKESSCRHVAGFTFDDKRGTGDVCFYVPMAVQSEIGEILVVSDYNKNQLLLLDYMSGCGVLETVDVTSPVSLAKNPDGKLWVNCKISGEKSEILCF